MRFHDMFCEKATDWRKQYFRKNYRSHKLYFPHFRVVSDDTDNLTVFF